MSNTTTNPATPEVGGASRAMFQNWATAHPMLRGLTVPYGPEDDAGGAGGGEGGGDAPDTSDTEGAEGAQTTEASSDAGQTEGEDAGGDASDDQTDGAAGDDDAEEIEHNGAKYKLPKAVAEALKPALMKDADYTRKTQALAAERQAIAEQYRTWEQQRAQQAEMLSALRPEIGAVHAIEQQLADFDRVPWDALKASDIDEYRNLRDLRTDLREKLEGARKALSAKEGELATKREETLANQRKELGQALAKEIPDFGPETVRQIATYAAQELGVSAEELASVTDVRTWKMLHRARSAESRASAAEAELSKLKSQRQTAKNHEKAQQVTPAKTVGNAGQFKPGVNDELNTKEWVKRRNAELAKKRAR